MRLELTQSTSTVKVSTPLLLSFVIVSHVENALATETHSVLAGGIGRKCKLRLAHGVFADGIGQN